MKILLIRFSSIGDIVLCSPAIRCLKASFPQTELHFLTKKKFRSLLEFNPALNKIHNLDGSLSRLCNELKNEKYDLVIDFHGSLRSRWLCLLLGRPVLRLEKGNFAKWLLVTFGIRPKETRHVADRYLDTLLPLGVTSDGKGLDYFACNCEEPDWNELPAFISREKFTILSVGGTHFTKRMPAEKWISLISQLPGAIVIAGGKEDVATASTLEKAAASAGKQVFNACGQFSIGGSAWLISKAALVISHDTGLMHIAAAFRRPVVCIWGNTVPEFGFYPWKTESYQLEVMDLSCRPCTRIGKAACPKGHFACMNRQDLSDPGLHQFIQRALNN